MKGFSMFKTVGYMCAALLLAHQIPALGMSMFFGRCTKGGNKKCCSQQPKKKKPTQHLQQNSQLTEHEKETLQKAFLLAIRKENSDLERLKQIVRKYKPSPEDLHSCIFNRNRYISNLDNKMKIIAESSDVLDELKPYNLLFNEHYGKINPFIHDTESNTFEFLLQAGVSFSLEDQGKKLNQKLDNHLTSCSSTKCIDYYKGLIDTLTFEEAEQITRR